MLDGMVGGFVEAVHLGAVEVLQQRGLFGHGHLVWLAGSSRCSTSPRLSPPSALSIISGFIVFGRNVVLSWVESQVAIGLLSL